MPTSKGWRPRTSMACCYADIASTDSVLVRFRDVVHAWVDIEVGDHPKAIRKKLKSGVKSNPNGGRRDAFFVIGCVGPGWTEFKSCDAHRETYRSFSVASRCAATPANSSARET